MKRAAYLLLPVVACAMTRAAVAQLHVSETAEVKAVKITFHPAAEPRPALKCRLLPTMPDRALLTRAGGETVGSF